MSYLLAGSSASSAAHGAEFLQALLAVQAKHIHDRYYKNETIYLDGYTFTNCCFHNCTLVAETGVFSIESCTVAGCAAHFGANAIRMIQLYNLIAPHYAASALFHPTLGLDGAVTIK